MKFTKFNKTNRIEWGISTENLPFKKLGDIFNEGVKLVKIRGFYLQNGRFGKQANAITDSCILNVPTHMTKTIEEILNDSEAIEAIKNGECWVSIHKYHSSTYNKDCYSFDFVEESDTIEDLPNE
jgi:hypothetical protein